MTGFHLVPSVARMPLLLILLQPRNLHLIAVPQPLNSYDNHPPQFSLLSRSRHSSSYRSVRNRRIVCDKYGCSRFIHVLL